MKRNPSRLLACALLALLAISLSSCAALAQPPLNSTPMPSATSAMAETSPTSQPTSTPMPTAVEAVSATVVAAATAVPEATAVVPSELPVTGTSAELNALLGLLPLVALLLLAVPAVVGWRSGQR